MSRRDPTGPSSRAVKEIEKAVNSGKCSGFILCRCGRKRRWRTTDEYREAEQVDRETGGTAAREAVEFMVEIDPCRGPVVQ